MIFANTRVLFRSVVTIILCGLGLLVNTSIPVQAGPEARDRPLIRLNGDNFVAQSVSRTGDIFNPVPARSAQVSPAASAGAITGTITFTHTEHFETHTFMDPAKTTIDWDITADVLTLQKLSNAAEQRTPAITVDAAGNTYVVWQDDRRGNRDIYAQGFDPDGRRLWSNDVRINSDSGSVEQLSPAIALDMTGNLFIVWADDREASQTIYPEHIYAQKLDANGSKLWNTDVQVDGGPVNAYRTDPAIALNSKTGDMIVAWDDFRNGNSDIYAQRLTPDGVRHWSVDIRVNTDFGATGQTDPALGVDKQGDILVAWSDTRNDNSCPTCPFPDYDIYAQKLNASGSPQWQTDRRVTSEVGSSSPSGFGFSVITIDDAGNSYIVWKHNYSEIYAQKLDADGKKLWPNNRQVNDPGNSAGPPTAALDSNGNVFVAWSERPVFQNSDVYVQKLDTEIGNPLWETPLWVDRGNGASTPAAGVDGGDLHLVWQDRRNGQRDIYMQKIDAEGIKLWPADLRANSDVGTPTRLPSIVAAGSGDSYITWGDARNTFPEFNIYVRQLKNDGTLGWSDDRRVNVKILDITEAAFNGPAISLNPAGAQVAIAWDDNETIYARMLQPDGNFSWDTETPVSSSVVNSRLNVDITLDESGNSYVIWEDRRHAIQPGFYTDLYFQKLGSDGLKTWESDREVGVPERFGNSSQVFPEIVFDRDANYLYLAWPDSQSGHNTDIYAQLLDLDGNPTWEETPLIYGDQAMTSRPAIATANGAAYITWGGSQNNEPEIYAQKLSNSGNKAWPGDALVGDGEKPSISTTANGDSYVVWRALNGADYDIFAQLLANEDGATVWPSPIQVNSDPDGTTQDNPAVSVDAAGNAYVVWEDFRRARPDIYAQKLLPGGAKGWVEDVRITADLYRVQGKAYSLALDATSNDIEWATLSVGVAQHSPGATIEYYLSNNGGQTWENVAPGIQHTFTSAGSDLRWRIEFTSSLDQTQTPVIDWLRLNYFVGDIAPNSVFLRDENDQAGPEADIYHNGQWVGRTDNEGVLVIGGLQAGDTLVALEPLDEQATVRGAHDVDGQGNFAYRVYRTNLPITGPGLVEPYRVPGPDAQHILKVEPNNTLVLFNLVVSIEWDADEGYMAEIEQAMQGASDYLYDLTDGQMAFGWVKIFDEGNHWTDADIQISAKNIVHPHAYIGGITSADRARVIRLGRNWDGNSGNRGGWAQKEGYRTIAHEFGHYALHLYDEYLVFLFDANDRLVQTRPSFCTTPHQAMAADQEATSASAMYHQYKASELSAYQVPGMWSPKCEQTAQWVMTRRLFGQGESAWQTWTRMYADRTIPSRWQFQTPLERQTVMKGPAGVPAQVLALPQVAINNEGPSGPPRYLTVTDHQGEPYWGAIVALYKTDGRVIGQGFTGDNGRLTVYGAEAGDDLRAAAIDGGLAGKETVGGDENITLPLTPIVSDLTGQAAGGIPHMRVIAEPGAAPDQVDLLISLINFGPGADPRMTITEPGEAVGYSPPVVPYNPTTEAYEVTVSFSAAKQGTGHLRASGEVENHIARLQATYRLHRVFNSQDQTIYSDDGDLSLHIQRESLPGREAYFVVTPAGAVPGPVPDGLRLVGDSYDLTASGALVELEQAGSLTMHYDGTLVNPSMIPDGLSIYRWQPGLNGETGRWQAVGGEIDEDQQTISAFITTLGSYALMALPGSGHEKSYLPIVIKAVPRK